MGGGGGGGEFTRQEAVSSVFGTSKSDVFCPLDGRVLQQLPLGVMFSVFGTTLVVRDEGFSSGVFGGFTLIPLPFVVE